MPSWRRTETRLVRPFPSVDECLTGVRLRFHPDADFDERTSFDASEAGLRDMRPEFRLAVEVPAPQASEPLTADDLFLVIRLADKRLHRSEIVFQAGLDTLPETWAVPANVRDRFSWKFGLDVSVALVLRSDRLPEPGRPFMRGHWVARKDFSVRPRAEPRAFPVERWTAEDFARQGLPPDSVYWIQFMVDDLNSRFDDPSEAFRVCLRADVYDAFVDAQETVPGRALMSMIAAEILAEVIWRGLSNLDSGEELETGGLLHSAIARVKKATNAAEDTLRRFVAERELSSLRAFAQATIGAQRAVARLRAAT